MTRLTRIRIPAEMLARITQSEVILQTPGSHPMSLINPCSNTKYSTTDPTTLTKILFRWAAQNLVGNLIEHARSTYFYPPSPDLTGLAALPKLSCFATTAVHRKKRRQVSICARDRPFSSRRHRCGNSVSCHYCNCIFTFPLEY